MRKNISCAGLFLSRRVIFLSWQRMISTCSLCWWMFLVLLGVSSGVTSSSQFRSFSFSERDIIRRFLWVDVLCSPTFSLPSEGSGGVFIPMADTFWENDNSVIIENISHNLNRYIISLVGRHIMADDWIKYSSFFKLFWCFVFFPKNLINLNMPYYGSLSIYCPQ